MNLSSPMTFFWASAALLTASSIYSSASQTEASLPSDSAYAVDSSIDLRDTRVINQAAYISPQCYTKVQDASGRIYNPCYTCHTRGTTPNYLDDSDLQLVYSFPADALKNPWTNLFVDRRDAVAAVGDTEMLGYVRTDNYRGGSGRIVIADALSSELPTNWDLDADGRWDGYVPDAYFNFDAQGFDHDTSDAYTGWRAFAYYPFPGTFWPTNGSAGDVLIRLPAAFRETDAGVFDPRIYRINLAIVESLVRRQNVPIEPVQESDYGVDLNRDGRLAEADQVVFDWAPLAGRLMSYVGRAAALQASGKVHLAAGLFPEGTEFLHSLRYLDLDGNGKVQLARRMKELRYARKTGWYTYAELKGIADRERTERSLDPDALKSVPGDYERGLFTQGWVYQGFIEDGSGALRPQSQEETLACMGCHGGVGATTDSVFAFPRRLPSDSFQGGWFHWTQHGLGGIAEPRLADGTYEYSHYLAVNGAGDEYRANEEVMERFFDAQGQLKPERIEALHKDISTLLLPSAQRALTMDKSYRIIVKEQSFVDGREATIRPPENVLR